MKQFAFLLRKLESMIEKATLASRHAKNSKRAGSRLLVPIVIKISLLLVDL